MPCGEGVAYGRNVREASEKEKLSGDKVDWRKIEREKERERERERERESPES